jgi:hypothetical protein
MEFTEPPLMKHQKSRKHWTEIVQQLRDNPGKWALVGNYSPGVATHIRRGKYPAFLETHGTLEENLAYMTKHWDVTTRKTGEGRNDVFIRWYA